MKKAAAWLAIGLVSSPIGVAPMPGLAQGATPLPARENLGRVNEHKSVLFWYVC